MGIRVADVLKVSSVKMTKVCSRTRDLYKFILFLLLNQDSCVIVTDFESATLE
jgi:hypothetical protein